MIISKSTLSGADVKRSSDRNTFRHLFSVLATGLTIKISAESGAIFTPVHTAHLLSNAAGCGGKTNPKNVSKQAIYVFFDTISSLTRVGGICMYISVYAKEIV